MRNIFLSVTTLLVVILSFSSVTSAQQSGFLGDYSKLKMDDRFKDEGLLIQVNEDLDLGNFDKILIKYPLIYLQNQDGPVEINSRELIMLSDYFHEKLIGALEDNYTLADEPGPGVLVIRVAITNVVPIRAKKAAVTKMVLKVVNLDMGGASIEAEFIDGGTGKQLLALTDTESGKRFAIGSAGMKTWGHTKSAFKNWSKRLSTFLGDDRYGKVQEKQD